MASLTATRAARKPLERKAHVSKIGGAFILWLTVGKDITAYRVRPLASQLGGAAYRLEKADKGDGQREDYDVHLDGQQSTCECKGFLKHGMCKDGKGCKHIAGLTAAVAAKQLPAPTVKPQAAPRQAAPQEPETCWEPRCNRAAVNGCYCDLHNGI